MKPTHQKVAALSTLALFILAACGGGGGSSGVTPGTIPPVGGSTSAIPSALTFTYGSSALQGATYVGPVTNATMGIDVALTLQNEQGLIQYAQAVNNPKSAQYRRFITAQQIGQSYGASQTNLTAAEQYFQSYNLHVGTWPQHLSLFVSGPTQVLQQAFGTTFGIYQSGTTKFVAPTTTPHFTKVLPVAAVRGLVSMQRQFTTYVPIGGGNALTTSGYTPQQIRNAFDYTSAYNAGYTGAGITIGIIGTGAFNPNDVPAYASMFNTNVATVTEKLVSDTMPTPPPGVTLSATPDPGLQTPPPATAPCNGALPGCNPEDTEAQVDTEAAASLAPGATVDFYLAYDPMLCENSANAGIPGPCDPTAGENAEEGLPLADDEIQQAISDDQVDVLSLSYGGPEAAQVGYEFGLQGQPITSGPGPDEFAALAAEGVAVFVSSGDSGAEGCQRSGFGNINQPCLSYPATDPNVLSVGGVNAPLDQFGNLTNQIIGWGYTTDKGSGGSGGGVSGYFPVSLTPWQQGMPGVLSAPGANRNQPDAALLGDNYTGMATLMDAGLGGPLVESVGGTSVAAPEMAAMWALVLQACKRSASCATAQGAKNYRLGNPAPIFYSLYATPNQPANTSPTYLPTYAQTFYDVVYGNNAQNVNGATPAPGIPVDQGYNAGPGYDQVSGLGVPFARALIKAVTKQ